MAVSHIKAIGDIMVLCDNCFNVITNVTRIKCYDCHIDQCFLCFFDRITFSNHNPTTHSYQAIEPLNFSTVEGWTVFEELVFIDALHMFGIGNWQEIGDFIGKKTKEEVENYFDKLCDFQKKSDRFEKRKKSSNSSSSDAALYSNPNIHEIISYMPLRNDFDTEYKNDFENIFKDLNNDSLFLNNENEDIKYALYDAYNNVLKARNYRKFIYIEKNMLSFKELSKNETKINSNPTYKNILTILKPFSTLLSKKDFNVLLNTLCYESSLIEKLRKENIVHYDYLDNERKRYLLLSENEKNLCHNFKLSFKEYLKIKEITIESYIKNKNIDLFHIKSLVGCNDERIDAIFNFFCKNNWINKS